MLRSITNRGFTIVELLIVIVVIAILAVIALVAYNGIQNSAYDSTIKADLRNLNAKVREYMVLNNEQIPTADQAGLESFAKVSKNAYLPRSGTSLLYCRSSSNYAFVAQSKSGSAWVMENGSTRQLTGNWGGTNDDNACGSNAIVGLVYGAQPGYGHMYLYRNSTWQTWVSG